jgi:predicted DNA-binding protein
MATTVKVTFTLDEATVRRLRNAAERLAKPKSQVVREAIYDYHERIGKLSEAERLHKLKIFEEIMAKPSTRSQAEAEKELREIRRARRYFRSSFLQREGDR